MMLQPARGCPCCGMVSKASALFPGVQMTPAGHVLLVDDDEAFSYAACRALQAAGFEVFVAPDYRLALQILESPQQLDLLITDLVMPDRMNGFALARMARMKRLGLPVLYVTAYDDIPQEEASGKILRKPIATETLVIEAQSAIADGVAR